MNKLMKEFLINYLFAIFLGHDIIDVLDIAGEW